VKRELAKKTSARRRAITFDIGDMALADATLRGVPTRCGAARRTAAAALSDMI